MRILVALIGLYFLSSCNNNASADLTSSYQQTKTNLEETERNNPSQFLSINGRYWKNWIGQWVCEGTIINAASIATYKDVVLRVGYFSKTNSEIGSEEKTLFEYFKPNSNQHFKIKMSGVDSAASIKVEVISALNVPATQAN